MLGAPLVAIGFASGSDLIAGLGAVVELLGATALVVHGAAVQRDRGRWTSDHGWHRFAGLSLVTAPGWLLVTLAIGAGRILTLGATPEAWDVRRLVVPLVAGWIGQVLIGSWTHLVPAIGPGDPPRHAEQRQRLGRAATTRWLLWNGGVSLATVGALADADWLIATGGVALGLSLAGALWLLALAMISGRVRREPAA
jgi:nitrite reductase (NO-forming)